jgi:C-terminal processing protease CtpA/Prc
MARCQVGVVFTLALAILYSSVSCAAQNKPGEQMSTLRRQQAQQVLRDAEDVLKKVYYDPNYHGVDIQARLKQGEEHLQTVNSLSEAFGVVAWYFEPLNDSHTFFLPPPRPFDIQRGWETRFVGDNCFITAVKPGSDADAQGMKPGDQVLAIEGFQPTRQTLWKLQYAFNSLAPRSAMHLAIASPNSQPRQLEVKSTVIELKQRLVMMDYWDLVRKRENIEQETKIRTAETGDLTMIKLPSFVTEDDKIDDLIHKMTNHGGLVLDLRGNPGGSEEILTRLTGGLFDHDVKIADHVGRKEKKAVIAKSRGDHAFHGKLVVLIDAGSASAAELMARTIQIEKRGVVMGDRSSGSVMAAKIFPYHQGDAGEFNYSFEVTVADPVMTDGRSLEHVGVTPDELLLPTAEDLAAGRDPVLAHAVESLGGKLTPEDAGKVFPVVWHKPQ